MATEKDKNINFDYRLTMPLEFVCKTLDVTKKDFASLALSNLISEELDWIEHNGFRADFKEIERHKKTVNVVKFEANGWVINKK